MRVLELELTGGLHPIGGCAGYGAVRILVRRRGRPVGWVVIHDPNDTISGDVLHSAIEAQVSHLLWRPLLADCLESEDLADALPPISVVVCTRDRAALLGDCLRSLGRVAYPAFEVVVVDNAPSSAETERLVGQLHEDVRFRYAREARPGLDWARNRGIIEARHDLIAFTDDDVRVDAGWLRGLARAFADPGVGVVTGLVAPAELETEAQQLFELVYGGMGKGMLPRQWFRGTLDAYNLVTVHHVGAGANMAFRRGVLEELRGFDTALDVGTPSHGGGDLDVFHRALVSGATIRYEPTALVWHRHRVDMSSLRRQLYDNGRAFGVYLLLLCHRGDVSRFVTANVARIWMQWHVGRVIQRVLRRELLPLPLILAEMRGSLHAWSAYYQTYRHDRRIRAGTYESQRPRQGSTGGGT